MSVIQLFSVAVGAVGPFPDVLSLPLRFLLSVLGCAPLPFVAHILVATTLLLMLLVMLMLPVAPLKNLINI